MTRALVVSGLLLTLSCTSTPPAVATCTAPQSACGNECADLSRDDKHCGSCSTACGASEACANGACYPTSCAGMPCDPGSVCYMNLCTEKDCVGVLCPQGQVCKAGACICESGKTSCNGSCVDLALDDSHCGACATACDAGTSCARGTCIADDCAQEDCDPLSVCFSGSCTERSCVGVICGGGNTCHDGACGCQAGVQCGTTCADVQLDSANCGGCGKACDGGTRCAVGTCLPTSCNGVECDPLSVCFAGTCTEAACVGVLCAAGQVCSQGRCVCPAGKIACGADCADLSSSTKHCGGCGTLCAANESCVSGQCVVSSCMPGKIQCSGACVDTSTDPNNCSACGAACGGGRNCVGGSCSCPQGLALCGSTCVNLGTDPANCGRCGKSCGGGACQADGGCDCAAGSGLTFCSGTCADLMSDPNNCNGCGRRCATGQACTGGVCGCAVGQRLCSGACLDVQGDNLNCGNCGVMCPAGTQCTAGACVPPVACFTNFNDAGTCPFFPLDDLGCGAATTVGTIPFSGNLTVTNAEVITLLDAGVSSYLVATGSYSGGGNVSERWRNDLTSQIGGDNNSTTGAVPRIKIDSVTGSPWTCAHPVDFVVRDTYSGGPVMFSGSIVHQVLERYNTYGTTNGSAPSLNLPDGGLCTQVCGNVSKTCGDDRAWYRITIPPRRAVVLEYRVSSPTGGGANLHWQAARPNGAAICNLTNNVIIGTTPSTYRARMLNNTDVPQDTVVGPYLFGSGAGQWTMAVGLE